MAYLVGTTTVIDASGNIAWARITGVPTIGDITGVTVTNGTPTATYALYGTGVVNTGFGSPPYTYNCYVDSLSGGGTSGEVTVTTNRKIFNCNCACRC